MLCFLYCFCILDVFCALCFPIGITLCGTLYVVSSAFGLGVIYLDFVSTKSHLGFF